MGTKNKSRVKALTREEKIVQQTTRMLTASTITPAMVFDMLTLGSEVYRSGLGLPWEHVIEHVLKAFRQQGREYLHPCQMAALKNRHDCEEDDWHHLET